MLQYLYNLLTNMSSSILKTLGQNEVDEILPNLWLGDYTAALDTDFLLNNNIDYIVNCTQTIPFIHDTIDPSEVSKSELKQITQIDTFRIPVNDSLLEKDFIIMEQYFKIILPLLLRKYTIEKKKILIHCHAGKQRSAIAMAAFLKILNDNKYINLTSIPQNNIEKSLQFEEICNYLLTKRPQVFTYGYRVNFSKTFKRYFNINL